MRAPLLAALAIALAACAPRTFPSAPAPATPAPAPPSAPALREAPLNWHLLDAADGVPGISLLRAERELLKGKEPKRTVLVAVIDNGLDTTHASLRGRLWANPKEIPGNGRDDDNNGYADDVRGWNLIGGRNGKYVNQDTYELTRLAAQCEDTNGGRSLVPEPYRQRCPEIAAEFTRKRGEVEQTLANVRQIETIYAQILPYLRRATGTDSLTRAKVDSIQTTNDTVRQARQIFLQLAAQGITPDEVAGAKKAYESQRQYGYNKKFDSRPIVGDDYPDTLVKRYGNTDIVGPGGEHGTHVAAIIGGRREVGSGEPGGIVQSVRLMAVRVVPDGDERDKDIALAIRYAVDEGAQIINMSFGKSYSPYKALVDAAVKYADSKGVLMVHASGNEGADTDKNKSFPNPIYLDGGRARNWIEVGASSWKANDSLVASFSNYGHFVVDVFAPGEDIYSAAPKNGFKKASGTSAASPVVAGLAALLMSYYPNLTATDVKRIILESSTRFPDKMVVRPGASGDRVRFGDLSATGGIVNAYAAVRMAEGIRP
jgi:subtilisin family serine protease